MTEITGTENSENHPSADSRSISPREVSGSDSATVPGYDVDAPTPVYANKPSSPDNAGALPRDDGHEASPEDPFTHEVVHSQPAQAEASPTAPVEEHAGEVVPAEVEGLKAMFPDFDVETLLSVLGSVGGNQERAADVLLGMSDPNYQPQHQAEPTQTELDEQLARRLAYEDQQRQQQYQARWQPNNQYGHDPSQRPFGDYASQQPYQNSQGGHYDDARAQWSNQQTGGGRDTMAEVQEQFNKIAESGKRTFSSLVTKVKAKMQEFDQSHSSSNPNTNSQGQGSWGSGSVGSASAQLGSNAETQENFYAPPRPSNSNDTTPSTVLDTATSDTAMPQAGTRSSVSAPVLPSERIPPRPSSAGPPPAGNVDPAKIGMLPKRVSVLGTTPPQPNAQRDEEEELDYVENPFDDERK